MPQNDSLKGAQQKLESQQKESHQQNTKTEQKVDEAQAKEGLKSTEQTAAELALQQAQVGLNFFLLLQQAASMQQLQPQQHAEEGPTETAQSSSEIERQNEPLHSALCNLLGLGKASWPLCSSPLLPTTQQQTNGIPTIVTSNEEKRKRDLSIIGRRWEYVSDVQSFADFEQLRCRHQVSRNRTFAHGIRYSCTQKTQLRSNCPYLLLCLFSDGAGEHSASGVGTISVYSRNKHTHPVKVIKARQPRRFAKLAKREQKWAKGEAEEEKNGNGKETMTERGKAENGAEANGAGERGKTLIEILTKMLAEQQKDEEGVKVK